MTRETADKLSRSPHDTVDMTVPDDDTTFINMPLNVNESDQNNVLSNTDPDTNFKRLTHCQYFDNTSFKSNFKNSQTMSIFHPNIGSFAKNLNQNVVSDH